jgi:hypothetical protein
MLKSLAPIAFAAILALCSATVWARSEVDTATYTRCAAACRDCEKACAACNKHCVAMVKSGNKEHAVSARLSADCMDICATAAKLCARKGPMSADICKACAAACEGCGSECGKYPNMAVMSACKKSCVACAAACHELISASGSVQD